ncbi:MAG: glycosyltransferase family 39 protein [Rhodobacterales bacterium]|nr:glycosyltransferase family 39 protein [Rhodobacterales bacterium]
MNSRFDPPLPVVLAAAGLFAVALWLRLMGTDWDAWANLHPDERHMVFVTQDIQRALEAALAEGRGWWSIWFGPDAVFDPRAEGKLYVYGDLPLIVVTLVSRALGATDWGSTLWLGRSLTAVVEASTVLAVFMLGLRLVGRPVVALAAAALMAMAPTSLQLANFYTVDGWLSALSLWALVPLAALIGPEGRLRHAVAAGVLAGLAGACKVTAVALILPALVAVVLVWRQRGPRAALSAGAAGLTAGLLVFRLANPSAFAGTGFWGLSLSPDMLADFAEVRAYIRDPGPPSNWQWLAGYPTSALARDAFLFGTGPVLGLLALAGLLRRPVGMAWLLLAALAGHLALNATGEVRALRYLAPVVPLAAVLAVPVLARLPALALGMVVALGVWWGWGMVRLHDGQHPRLIATEWMRRLPPDTAVASESAWDDSLPVWQTFPAAEWSVMPGPFRSIPLGLTDFQEPDSPARIAAALDEAEYLSISSGRQLEVMPRLPERFPTVTNYYAALLSGRLCFERVLYLDRGYPLPGFRLDDRFAQEPWRVYDHPIVQFWKKLPCFDRAKAERLLAGQE